MFPKRAYRLVFIVFELSAVVSVALNLVAEAADIGTVTAAADAVTAIYGAVVTPRSPDRAWFPPGWGPLEYGVVVAELYTVGIAFQLYAVVTWRSNGPSGYRRRALLPETCL